METIGKYGKNLFLTLGLTALTLYFLLRDGQIRFLIPALKLVNPYYIALGVVGMILFFFCQALCNWILMRSFRYHLSYRQCLRYTLIDFYFSSITPACCGGQPSQIYYMKKDGIEIGSSSLSILIFNLAYHLAVLIVAGISICFGGRQILYEIGHFRYLLLYGAMAQGALVVLFLCIVFSKKLMPRIAFGGIKLLHRIGFIPDDKKMALRFIRQIRKYRAGAEHIRDNPRLLGQIIGIAVVHIFLLYLTPYWVYKAFGLQGHTYLSIVAIQAALTLCVETLPIPGGIGVAEGGFLKLYGMIFGRGNVLAAMVLCRGLSYYFAMTVSFFVTFFTRSEPVKMIENV